MVHHLGQLGHAYCQAGHPGEVMANGKEERSFGFKVQVESARGGVQEASGHPDLELRRQLHRGLLLGAINMRKNWKCERMRLILNERRASIKAPGTNNPRKVTGKATISVLRGSLQEVGLSRK